MNPPVKELSGTCKRMKARQPVLVVLQCVFAWQAFLKPTGVVAGNQ